MEEPNITQKAKNLVGSIANWAIHDKFSQVDNEVFEERKKICLLCPNWDKEGYNGYGKCNICGCSIAKLYIPSATCPLSPPKWVPTSS
jgi:hypothetical protein